MELCLAMLMVSLCSVSSPYTDSFLSSLKGVEEWVVMVTFEDVINLIKLPIELFIY